jgi:hypothetical protein
VGRWRGSEWHGDALGQGSQGDCRVGSAIVPVGSYQFEFNSNYFNLIKNCSNFIQSKQGLPMLEKFEIKYCCEGFEIWNNFL